LTCTERGSPSVQKEGITAYRNPSVVAVETRSPELMRSMGGGGVHERCSTNFRGRAQPESCASLKNTEDESIPCPKRQRAQGTSQKVDVRWESISGRDLTIPSRRKTILDDSIETPAQSNIGTFPRKKRRWRHGGDHGPFKKKKAGYPRKMRRKKEGENNIPHDQKEGRTEKLGEEINA